MNVENILHDTDFLLLYMKLSFCGNKLVLALWVITSKTKHFGFSCNSYRAGVWVFFMILNHVFDLVPSKM